MIWRYKQGSQLHCLPFTILQGTISEISEYNGPNIDYEIYHQGGGGYLEAEGLGGDDPEGAAKRDIIAEHMWRDYQEYIADREEEEESEMSEEE